MGFWGAVKSFFGFGSSSGSRSTSTYNYEPDKVKVAQIEADLKLKLADKEAERIELMRDAQLELLKAQTMSQMAIDEARVKNMAVMADQLVVLQEKMLDVAKKRIAIIEEGSMPIVKEIEAFYAEVNGRIEAAGDEYNTKKLPQLLALLGNYEKGSPEYEIFMSQIQDDRARQNRFVVEQMEQVRERQNLVLNSFLATKEKIIDQTGQITQRIAEEYMKKPFDASLPQSGAAKLNQLSGDDKKLLSGNVSKPVDLDEHKK